MGLMRDLSVEKINDKTCEFRSRIRGSARANGLPHQNEAFHGSSSKQAPREPLLEAHDRQERLLFPEGIERHALEGN